MAHLFTKKDFYNAKSKDKLPCKCEYCEITFFETKHNIQRALNPNNKTRNMYCSKKCKGKASNKKQTITCTNCDISFEKSNAEIKKSKNHFCSKSCSVTYNNKNKSTGTRRSKLEIWLEAQLTTQYPNIEFHFNKKDAIGSELDIYIPTLSLAFELNGIFHYEPIYGVRKLDQIQENDQNKYKTCLDKQIDLCIIDTSGLTYFKPQNAQKYLDIISNIIKERC
jgi:hypothetical protein